MIDGFLESDGILETRTDGIQGSIDDISDDREALNLRLDSLQARLLKQFSAMDALVAQLSTTSSFLAVMRNVVQTETGRKLKADSHFADIFCDREFQEQDITC